MAQEIVRAIRSARAGITFLILTTSLGWSQSTSSLTGLVKDPQGAAVPSATLNMKNAQTGVTLTTTSNKDGIYAFPSVTPGHYVLTGNAAGFGTSTLNDIVIQLDEQGRLDLSLTIGAVTEQITVQGAGGIISPDNATIEADISPEVENQLPILVSGGPRRATAFLALVPGNIVNGGTSANVFTGAFNGGAPAGQEAIADGISLQEGGLSQGGNVSLGDFPMSPDTVSEVKALTTNYEAQYGATMSGVEIITTKSGTKEFHGAGFEYLRNTDLNAKQFGNRTRSKDNENDFGGSIGGPVKLPFLWTNRNKAYFFFNYEGFRSRGGITQSTISVPTLKERTGDFTDLINSATGALIPIYDPATTQVDASGNVTRKQFMGCNGNQPNVICPSRFDPSGNAQAYFALVPVPTNNLLTNNYLVPQSVGSSQLSNVNQFLVKIDEYVSENDHIAASWWRQSSPPLFSSNLPLEISDTTIYGAPENSTIWRTNWDHTFTTSLLNHFAFGYLNRNEGGGSLNAPFASKLPRIANVAGTGAPPLMSVGPISFGSSSGDPSQAISHRPTYITNDMVTYVHGKNVFTAGGEFRYLTFQQVSRSNEAGTFKFGSQQTGLFTPANSGNAYASFLLGAVQSASSTYYTDTQLNPRQHAIAVFVNDNWRVRENLTLDAGLRWDFWSPGTDAKGKNSWLDLSRANPFAGGRPGALVYSSKDAGAASASSSYPEKPFYKAFGPRLGFVYSVGANTVIRGGYGIYIDQLYYSDYLLGVSNAGYNITPTYSATGNGGLDPAFYLSQGFPATLPTTPSFSLGLANGQDSNGYNSTGQYRTSGTALMPYGQQFNLNIERSFHDGTHVSVAYVGNKGTHLFSTVDPKNYVPLKYLSLGTHLNDTFKANDTVIDGVPIPYDGWQQQMKGCSPTVAQALLPYPQFCNGLISKTEAEGYSNFNSFQVSVERRYKNGMFYSANYTWSKNLGTQSGLTATSGGEAFSPEQQSRNYHLNSNDLPHVFNFTALYQLPFGPGRKLLNANGLSARGVVANIVGGWDLASIAHLNSGVLIQFGAKCQIPSQFRNGNCLPELTGLPVRTLSQKQINANIINGQLTPLFNANAFVGASLPTPYTYVNQIPNGPYYPGVRGFAYKDLDVSLHKNTQLGDRVVFKFGIDAFNVLNQHSLGTSFNTGLTGTNFGTWTRGTSNPRNVQVVGRLEF